MPTLVRKDPSNEAHIAQDGEDVRRGDTVECLCGREVTANEFRPTGRPTETHPWGIGTTCLDKWEAENTTDEEAH